VKDGFSREKVEKLGPLDTIVIGSGLSGLAVAAMLARHGEKVLVLEQHDQAGGNCHTFAKRCAHDGQDVEFEFDTGVHYLGGELGTTSSMLRKLYDFVTGGAVEFGQLDDVYDVAVCTGEGKLDAAETFDFSADFKETEARLKEKFGNDEQSAIEDFFKELNRTTGFPVIGWFLWKIGAPKFLAKKFLEDAKRTTRETLSCIKGMTPKLMGVLTYCFGDHGLEPGKSSWVAQALISKHYEGGAFFPKGGPSRIAKAATAVINKCGGAVMVRAPVEKIIVGPNGVTGVQMQRGGATIEAKRVVSAAGVRNTYLKLLSKQSQDALGPVVDALKMHDDVVAQAKGQASGLEPSVCMVCLFVGLDSDDATLQLPRTNFWRFPSWNHDENMAAFMADPTLPLPGVFVSTSSSKDADWQRRHPGVSTVQVLAPVNYDWFIQYENSKLQNRGEEYAKFKGNWERRLLDHLYDQFPQVKGHVVFTELGTPLTNNHFMAAHEGEVYGASHTTQRYTVWQDALKPSTPIPGLYLTGQDIFCDGVGAALISGAITAFRASPSFACKNLSLIV
jgi:all-trans-retinol 13,14-reductase